MLPSARRRSAQNCFPREPLDQARAALVSSALGVTVGSNHAWVWSAQNRLTLFFATMIGVEAAYFGGGNFFVG